MRRVERFALLLALVALVSGCAPEGDPSAFVTFNIPPDSNCEVSPSEDTFIAIGQYDIAEGGMGLGSACERPYFVHLLVNSYLRPNADDRLGRSESNILRIHSAEVRLMTVDKRVITFDRGESVLPNPFLVTTNNSLEPARGTSPTTGIAAVEAIPVAYASQLNMFMGDQILAEIQVFGTTTGDVDVDFQPFVFPIEICDGCLTLCLERDVGEGAPSDYVEPGECADNSGQDGRVCIDPTC